MYGLGARKFTSTGMPMQTLAEMALDYVQEICKVQPAGPYYLAGWSLGGLLAYAIATELQGRGEHVAFLSLLDAAPFPAHEPEAICAKKFANVHQELLETLDNVAAIFGDNQKSESPDPLILYNRLRREGRIPPHFSKQHFIALLENFKYAHNLVQNFVPAVYNGDLLVF